MPPTTKKANFSKGILPMTRLSDARRLTLYSATSVPMLTNDSQIGSDLRVWADEDD